MKLALALLLLGQFAPQHVGTAPLDAEREARVQRLGKKFLDLSDGGKP